MNCPKFSQFGLLILFVGEAFASTVLAQSFSCPSAVSPPPELAQMNIIIDQVEYRGDNPLPESARSDLIKQIQRHSYTINPGDTDDAWLPEVIEVTVRGALEDRGYFLASPTGTPFLIHASENELHYAVQIELASGPQYRLGGVRFSNTRDKPLAFSEILLRGQLELNSGELFNASKVRTAMDKIMRLYQSKGYLDAVPEPITDIDGSDRRIDLNFKIDEGLAYRISGIDLLGVGNNTSKQFTLPQATGDFVDVSLWRKFFDANQSRFPAGAGFESTVRMDRDTQSSAIRVIVDFQACPPIPSTPVLH